MAFIDVISPGQADGRLAGLHRRVQSAGEVLGQSPPTGDDDSDWGHG